MLNSFLSRLLYFATVSVVVGTVWVVGWSSEISRVASRGWMPPLRPVDTEHMITPSPVVH